MAVTDFAALDSTKVKVWAAEVWKNGRDQSFWNSNGFVGKGMGDMNSPIYFVNALTAAPNGAGTSAVMQLVQDLQGDGVAGDDKLDGNEEAILNDAQTIKIDLLRNGTKSKGRMAEQATVIRFREQSKDTLAFWLADKMDEMFFLTASGRAFTLKTNGATRTAGSALPKLAYASDVVAASTNRLMYAGTATTEATLTTSDKMTWKLLLTAKAKAKRAKLRPIRQGGKDYYVVVMSPEQRRDLLSDSDYMTNVGRAAERGTTSNPLFNNALVTVDGLVLYEHNKVFNTGGLTSGTDKWGSGNTVDGAQAILLGSQALGYAKVTSSDWSESDNTDYQNRPGIGYGAMFGMLKPQFKTSGSASTREDYGLISVKTAAAIY